METIKYGSKKWKDIAHPLFDKHDRVCQEADYGDDCWNFFVAEDLIDKILNDKLIIDKSCVDFIFEKCFDGAIPFEEIYRTEEFENHVNYKYDKYIEFKRGEK
jgi:hypothetical protein